MATGRIGVTPTLRTRWSKQPSAGTTSLSGLDDNSVALVYDVGYEAVYRNGVLLSRGNDYTATNGTTVTLIDATLAGDIIEILANQLVPLADAISKGQFTAKGALLSATAASTPGVLTVGSNDQILTADSTTSTGLKWATPAGSNENYTLINTGGTSMSGSSTITVSGISSKNSLLFMIEGADAPNGSQLTLRLNGDTASNYYSVGPVVYSPSTYVSTINQSNTGSGTSFTLLYANTTDGRFIAAGGQIRGCNTSGIKTISYSAGCDGLNSYNFTANGRYEGTSTISSLSVIASGGNFTGGTLYVYGSA